MKSLSCPFSSYYCRETYDHKVSRLKPRQCVISQFWKLEV